MYLRGWEGSSFIVEIALRACAGSAGDRPVLCMAWKQAYLWYIALHGSELSSYTKV